MMKPAAFGDHVTPFHSPPGTPGEWIEDPLGYFGDVFVGPGFRVPFYIISPWTRGNRVFTERADHNSQILFLEEWLTAKGYQNIKTDQRVAWRHEHMSNLVNAFDFDHPDYSVPSIPTAPAPHLSSSGVWDGTALCEAQYPNSRPPVPYGEQNLTESLFFEDGFKEVVGYLTEGRYLVFEMAGFALTNPSANANAMGHVTVSPATPDHSSKNQRWVIHYSQGEESGIFKVSSAPDGRYIGAGGRLLPASQQAQAADLRISFLGNGKGYTVQYADGNSSVIAIGDGVVTNSPQEQRPLTGVKIWSVSYHD
ncbi:hypothetical protein VTN77DRAFT_1094 [Rasamsonia byssochlamydoides]|uniref:uncharacterized protein n=1 Tax=Rasamsonia byssochlamydoides TaxID=89139 RepID=UPI0037433540